MFKIRPHHAIDFYKADHRSQYPDGTNLVYSNFTPRSDRLAIMMSSDYDHKVVVFGIQSLCQALFIDLWQEEFFNKPKDEVIAYYKRRMDTSLGENAIKVQAMADLHDLGYLPVAIKALPEGSRSPIGVPVLTIENTIDEFYWLVNYVESVLSACLWKYMTSATIAYEYRKLIDKWCATTGGTPEFVPFQGHDFSFRGMSGLEDTVMSGSAHLLSFQGTDSVLAIDFLEDYYGANAGKEMVGGSVPATEHSVMCMGGQDDEIDTFKRLINDLYKTGVISIVSDTWDFWKVITEYIPRLKKDILARDGKVVIRPDSGDPVKIIAGYKVFAVDDLEVTTDDDGTYVFDGGIVWTIYDEYEEDSTVILDKSSGKYYLYKVNYWPDGSPSNIILVEEMPKHVIKGAVQCLWDTFGGTTTDKGYKTLDSHIGLIYGDSITLARAEEILSRLAAKGFSSDNIVFGIGSYTYEYVTRDTFGFAMKATFGEVEWEGREIFKDPATDSGEKKSAKGLLRVDWEAGEYVLSDQVSRMEEEGGCLEHVLINGRMHRTTTLAEIRERLL